MAKVISNHWGHPRRTDFSWFGNSVQYETLYEILVYTFSLGPLRDETLAQQFFSALAIFHAGRGCFLWMVKIARS